MEREAEEAVETLSFEQAYRDLVAAAKTRPPEGSFSSAQFADDTGLTQKQALDKLKAWMDEGQLHGDFYVVDGHRQWMFWFAEDG